MWLPATGATVFHTQCPLWIFVTPFVSVFLIILFVVFGDGS